VCRGIGAVEKPGSGEGCRGAGRGRVRRLQSTSVLRAPRHGRLVPRRPGLYSPPHPRNQALGEGLGPLPKQVLGEGLPPKKQCVRRGSVSSQETVRQARGSPFKKLCVRRGSVSSQETVRQARGSPFKKPCVRRGFGSPGEVARRGPRNHVFGMVCVPQETERGEAQETQCQVRVGVVS